MLNTALIPWEIFLTKPVNNDMGDLIKQQSHIIECIQAKARGLLRL